VDPVHRLIMTILDYDSYMPLQLTLVRCQWEIVDWADGLLKLPPVDVHHFLVVHEQCNWWRSTGMAIISISQLAITVHF